MRVRQRLREFCDEIACVCDLGLACPERCSLGNTAKCPKMKPELDSIIIPVHNETEVEIGIIHIETNTPTNRNRATSRC